MTKAEALKLTGALQRQLAQRLPAMRVEAVVSAGILKKLPEGIAVPPQWALRAAKVAFDSMLRGVDGKALTPKNLGALVGKSSVWEALLSRPEGEVLELETRHPEVTAFREKLKKLCEADFKIGKSVDSAVSKAPLKGSVLAQYHRGRAEGADSVMSEDGTLRDDHSIKAEVCYLLWLYWPHMADLKSLSSVMEFLEAFQVGGVTQKNLERICRQIGFRVKSRGRPKNLLRNRAK